MSCPVTDQSKVNQCNTINVRLPPTLYKHHHFFGYQYVMYTPSPMKPVRGSQHIPNTCHSPFHQWFPQTDFNEGLEASTSSVTVKTYKMSTSTKRRKKEEEEEKEAKRKKNKKQDSHLVGQSLHVENTTTSPAVLSSL